MFVDRYAAAIFGITLTLLASCSAIQSVENTPGASTSPGSIFFTGAKAQTALEQLETKVLIIPEGKQGWQLQSIQIPDGEEGLPFLFIYTDGVDVSFFL